MTYSADLTKLVLSIPMKSGIAADEVQMDFHYLATGAISDAEADAAALFMSHFLNSTASGATWPVSHYLGDECSQASNALSLKFYSVPTGGGPIGSPVVTRQLTLTATGTDTLPEEVACCLSFRTDYGAAVEFGSGTRPRSRLRNRVYLGPLSVTARSQDATTRRTKVSTAMITDVMASAIEFLYTEAFGAGWLWRTVSKTALQDHPVTYVEMDNAFDSQRRRGPEPTARAEAPVV